jgi:hypothetical protein
MMFGISFQTLSPKSTGIRPCADHLLKEFICNLFAGHIEVVSKPPLRPNKGHIESI